MVLQSHMALMELPLYYTAGRWSYLEGLRCLHSHFLLYELYFLFFSILDALASGALLTWEILNFSRLANSKR